MVLDPQNEETTLTKLEFDSFPLIEQMQALHEKVRQMMLLSEEFFEIPEDLLNFSIDDSMKNSEVVEKLKGEFSKLLVPANSSIHFALLQNGTGV